MFSVGKCPICGFEQFKLLCTDLVKVDQLDSLVPYERSWKKTLQAIDVVVAEFKVFFLLFVLVRFVFFLSRRARCLYTKIRW